MSGRRPCVPGIVRIAGALAAAAAPAAHAHLITTGLGPVYDGMSHFALTFEDSIPVAALALLAGLRGRAHARLAVFLLPLAWFVGGAVGVQAGRAPGVPLDWLPLVLLGGLVASNLALRPALTAALAVAAGLLLGYQNGVAMAAPDAPGLRGITGVTVTVFVCATLLSALVVRFHQGWLAIAWRVLGSWIAASGLLLLGWSLAR
ncbi:MAG: hypothetical protein U1F08_09705 [Steroidobacteraceae bacterium]